ncbi:hypothetical protein MARBORIA2_08670 [Methanobrevibacter arboriphilus]|jgi:glycosyltransferase involved in cell wall biosynthesis|uniref:glycosyltransferase n=1 Tax=Methanobrevibacter arboriphilus TaxID=39441 RepID=UPI0022EF9687|nr:glycosyltransferase [Methanobrevibacter arboriphilus]GLI11777.1 hypothetical protein MARBORIA2_08670 [Methanobrevibacter arboriphilus]
MVFKVSIIIPTYNREDYLRKTIDSVINQTIGFDNIELIIVDDASTDNTQLIIKEYKKKYSNIKTKYLNENTGFPGKPRNVGMSLATSEYIMFLDSDDYFEKDACEVLYEKISSENADIVFGTYTIHKMDRIIDGTPEYFRRKGTLIFNPKDDEFLKVIELVSTKLSINIYNKKLIDKYNIKYLEGIPTQDGPFFIECLLNSNSIIYLTDFNVYNYISHDYSITASRDVTYFKGLFKAENYAFNIFKNKNREEDYKYYLKRRINFFMNQLLSSNIEEENDLKEVLNLFKNFFNKVDSYSISPTDDLSKLTFNIIKNNEFDNFDYLTNVHLKVKRVWNHNEVLKLKNSNIKEKDKKTRAKNLELVEKNADLRKKYWKLREKNLELVEKNADLRKKYWKLREKNDASKKRIKELQTTKGWLNYKKSNVIDRIKNN